MFLVPSKLRLILILGVGGSGKTRLGKSLCLEIGKSYCHFINSEGIKAAIGEDVSFAENSASRQQAYVEMYRQVFRFLRDGQHVILDAPHRLELEQAGFLTSLDAQLQKRGLQAEIVLLWLVASEAQIVKNQRARHASRDKIQLGQPERAARERVEYAELMARYPHLEVGFPAYIKAEHCLPTLVEYILADAETREEWRAIQQAQQPVTAATI